MIKETHNVRILNTIQCEFYFRIRNELIENKSFNFIERDTRLELLRGFQIYRQVSNSMFFIYLQLNQNQIK